MPIAMATRACFCMVFTLSLVATNQFNQRGAAGLA
jgi:hypothetical protein